MIRDLAMRNRFTGGDIKSEIMSNQELAQELHKSFIRKLCVIDIFSKYKCVIPLKNKKVLQLLTLFKIF